jgi:hypothetical protein
LTPRTQKQTAATAGEPAIFDSDPEDSLDLDTSINAESYPKDAPIDVKHLRTDSEPIQPSDKDVLLVRGSRSNYHPGNLALRQLVLQFQPTYKEHPSKHEERTRIRDDIYRELKSNGSRFLAYSKESGLWYEVSDISALEAISSKLRAPRRYDEKTKTENKRDYEPDISRDEKKPKLETNSDINASMIRSDRMDTTDITDDANKNQT